VKSLCTGGLAREWRKKLEKIEEGEDRTLEHPSGDGHYDHLLTNVILIS